MKIQVIIIAGVVVAVVLGILFYAMTRTPNNPITLPGITPTQSVGPTIIEVDLPINPTDASAKQAESDANFQKDALQRDLRYPWIDRLPLSSANFFAYFDIEQQMLIIKIYGGDSPEKREEATQALQAESIPVNDLDIQWLNETN